MSKFRWRRRAALAGLLAAASIGAAAPAQAAEDHCDVRLDRLEAQFYDQADRHGYDAASEWWASRWKAYHQSCVV
jgi:hypothetical protein